VALIALGAPLNLTQYAVYQVTMMAAFAVAVLGLNIIMGYGGQVSLGQAAFLGLGAYVSAYGVTHGWNIVLVFVGARRVRAVVGGLGAGAAARWPGLALAMVTIALPLVDIPPARRVGGATGGSGGLTVSFMQAPEWTGLATDQWRYDVVLAVTGAFF